MSYKIDKKFHDNMILPADVPVKIFGEADYPVTVSVDMHTAVDFARDGRFTLTIPAHKAGGPYTMFLESEGKVTMIHGVSFGEADPADFAE